MTRRIRAASQDTTQGNERAAVAEAQRLASQVMARWQAGEPADAQVALDAHPELRRHRSIVLNLVYEDYCQRVERGESVDADGFAARFPTWQTAVRRQLEVHSFLAECLADDGRVEALAWPISGEHFLGFDLHEELGRGAIARVFLATEPALGNREVVVKISKQGGGEAQILGRLQHPNIVPILSVKEDEASGMSAVCMSYRGRVTLACLIDDLFQFGNPPRYARDVDQSMRRLAPEVERTSEAPPSSKGLFVDVVALYLMQLADALAYTHAQGTLHRDLKPSNILVADGGAPMLLDFNLSADPQNTIGRVGGTLPYMSPEQIRQVISVSSHGESVDVDGRSDLYSLGVIAYELLTGKQPFEDHCDGSLSPVAAARLLDRQRQGVAPVSRLNPQVDAPLSAVVDACLAFDLERRPASAAELAAALRAAMSVRRRAARWMRWHPKRCIAAALLGGAAIFMAGDAAYSTLSNLGRSIEHLVIDDWNAGRQAFDRGVYAEATGYFRKVTDRAPESGWAWFALGRSQQLSGAFSAAIESYDRAYQRRKDPRLLAGIAFAAAEMNDHPTATHFYQKAIDAGFDAPLVYYNQAMSFRKIAVGGRYPALESLNRAIDKDPQFGLAWRRRAHVRLEIAAAARQPPPPAVLDDLREAIRRSPPYPDLYLDAATITAIVDDGRGDLREEIRSYVERAVLCGAPRHRVVADKAVVTSIGQQELESILALRPTTTPTPPPSRFDPLLPEIPLPDDFEAE